MSSRGRGKRGQTGTYQQVKRQRNDIQNKKPCNLGKSCPYQHEYQHRLEFSHDQEPSSSSGNRLFPNSNGGSSTISFQGKGTRLGGNPLLPPTADEVAWLDTAATMQHYPPEDDAIEAVNANLVADATIASLCSPCSYAVCEICKLPVELKELDKHCAQHEQRGDYLRLRQEEEYEASMIADAKRLAKKQQDEVDAAEAARKQREEEDARAAVEVSLQERWKADMEKAKFDLLPEPSLENKSKNDAESIFSIRFTMPNGSRLVRRFNSNFPLKVSLMSSHKWKHSND